MVNKSKPTLRSRSTARVLDAISEGEIWGLLNGDKSIYLNGTQLQNSGGSYNFRGVRTNERKGTVGQDIINGWRSTTQEINDGRQIQAGSPVTFDVTDVDINAVDIKLRVNALYENTNKGKMKSNSVELQIDRQPNGGSFTTVGTVRIKGRTTSAYERHKRIELPDGGHPYTIRVRRITANNTNPQKANDTYISTYTLITDMKLNYPYTALVGIEVDAQKFGNQFPERVYEVGGILIDYPSNYNPNTRVYTGVWDGTFTRGQRCDNPAWVIWDLMTKNRYGLGHIFNSNNVDKWTLYNIAQYCDGMVPDGFGGEEPRYTFNGVIANREDAAKLLDRLTAIFRGMLYWQSGSVTFTHDAPSLETPKIVTRANVIGGKFSYSMAAKKTRHTHAIVTYNDPAKLGEANFEYVEHGDLLERYGYQPIELAAFGCTSPGQAHRYGEWLIDSEQHEPDLVSYRCSLDHMDVRPGRIIEIYDPWYAGARMGGRVIECVATQVTLDAPYDGTDGFLRVTMPDGTVEERDIVSVSGATITVNSAFPDTPIVGAMYGIANNDINPRKFRVVAVSAKDNMTFEISALLHDPTKYDRVERDITLTPPSYTAFDGNALVAPTGLDIVETTSDNGDEYAPSAALSWVPSVDARVQRYGVQILDADDLDWQEEIIVEGTSLSYDECPIGDLTFRIRSLSDIVPPSDYVQSAVETIIGYPDPTPYVALTAVGKFRKVVLKFAENTDEKFKRAIIYASQTDNFSTATIIDYAPLGRKRLVHDDLGKKETWYYWIAPQDKYLRIGTRYPNTTAGIAATTVPIDDDDTDDDLAAAPTSLTVTKIQEKDESGKIGTYLEMDCTFPGWASTKADAIYEISVTGKAKPYKEIGENGKPATFRVNKTGVLHSIRARIKGGAGKLGAWTSAVTITPTKKTADSVAITGMSYNRKNGVTRIKWDRITDPDNREVGIYRNTSNSFGGATLIDTTKGTSYADRDNVPKNTTYYYWVVPIDSSDNFGAFASSSVGVVETGLVLTDTDTTLLSAPTGISLTQANRDIDKDGTVDIALFTTFSGGVSGASGYEFEWLDSAGQSASARADTGKAWFIANTQRNYQVRWRTISWNGQAGPWSSYVGPVTPNPTIGAPGTPYSVAAFTLEYGFLVGWGTPPELDYDHTEIAVNSSGATPSAGDILTTSSSINTKVFYPPIGGGGYFVHVRHVNTSGLKSGWVTYGPIGTTFISNIQANAVDTLQIANNAVTGSKLFPGAVGGVATSNQGTSGGSVNAGSGSATLLTWTFRCSNNAVGVDITLGPKTWTNIDFINETPFTFCVTASGGGAFSASKSAGTITDSTISAITLK